MSGWQFVLCASSSAVYGPFEASACDVESTEVDERFLAGVERWRAGLTFFVTHFALTEAPLYRTSDGATSSVAMGAAGSPENLLAVCEDFRAGTLHLDDPMLLTVCSSVVDPSRAPAGCHTLKVISYLPYHVNGNLRHWDTIKDAVADRLWSHLCSLTVNLRDSHVLGRHVESPVDLERRNPHCWQGSCHGGDQDVSQDGYSRPMPGIFAVQGSSGWNVHDWCMHTSRGSVSGAPGRNAALIILEDLGLRNPTGRSI